MAQTGAQQLADLWKKQLDEGSEVWLRMLGQGRLTDPQSLWAPLMEQAMGVWSKLTTDGVPSADLLGQWKQFLDLWIAAWSKAFEQAMGTEQFAQIMGKQMETFLAGAGPIKKAVEPQLDAVLTGLGLPSRNQVIGIAAQLVQLEDKVDGLESRLDRVLKQLEDASAGAKRTRSG
jgi:hypothetical protein